MRVFLELESSLYISLCGQIFSLLRDSRVIYLENENLLDRSKL